MNRSKYQTNAPYRCYTRMYFVYYVHYASLATIKYLYGSRHYIRSYDSIKPE